MNNKVLARIVALVLTVMMLGTVAFANTAELTDGVITSTVDDTQSVYTLMAYAAESESDTTIADADIIAIEQSANIDDIKTITIDPSKVSTRYIKVVYGGKEGITKTATIDLFTEATLTAIDIDYGTYELGGLKISNVVEAIFTMEAAGKTITKVGVDFVGETAAEFTTADGDVIAAGTKTGAKVEEDVNIAGDGEVSFAAYLVGVPEADVNSIVATPYIEYY